MLVDVVYDFFPTLAFTQEQKRTNQHALGLEVRAEARKEDLLQG